jgi:hypothetical protein
LGNVALEFPHSRLAQFLSAMHQALKPDGRLALEYTDGLLRTPEMRAPEFVVEEGADERIELRFRGHDPKAGSVPHDLSQHHDRRDA